MKANYLTVYRCSYSSPEGKAYAQQQRIKKNLRIMGYMIFIFFIVSAFASCSLERGIKKNKYGQTVKVKCNKVDKSYYVK